MENKNLKKIITFLLIICWLIISVLSFKFIVLDENEKIDQAKSIKQINLKEERKIFGFEENEEYQKINEEVNEQNPITITKTIICGNDQDIYIGQVQTYTLIVKNNTDEVLKNINIVDEIPEECIFTEYTYNQSYQNEYIDNEGIKEFTAKIEEISANEQVELKYNVRVKKEESIIGNLVGTKAKAKIENDDNIYESNLIQNTIKASKLQIDFVCADNTKSPTMAGAETSFIIKLQNITGEIINNLEITYKIPEFLKYVESTYMYYEDEQYQENIDSPVINNNYNEENKTVTWNIDTLDSQEKTAVKVKVKIEDTLSENEMTISNSAQVNINGEKYNSNVFEINIINKLKANVQMKINPENVEFYEGDEFEYIVTINSEMNEDLGNITLIDNLPDGLVGKEIIINEDMDRKIHFEKNANIDLDVYSGETVTVRILVKVDSLPNDVKKLEVKNRVILTGMELVTEMSNEITTVLNKKENTENNPPIDDNDDEDDNNDDNNDNNDNNNNEPNPNEGENNNDNPGGNNSKPDENNNQNENLKFDLKIDKYISKVTVKNSKGTYQYNYEDAKLAKFEVDKKEINNTQMVIEYRILVTNVGNISGYVKEITDDKPEELEFKSEMNKDWYEVDGKIKNASIRDNIIDAGETKELTLILTKNITQNDIKTLINNAQITESIGDNGYSDNNKNNNTSRCKFYC